MTQITESNIKDPSAPHNVALGKAKIQLMVTKDAAFFTTLALGLKHKFDLSVPTAKTDGLQIVYNPNFFLKLNVKQQVFLIVHEAMHVAYMHMIRRGHRDPEKWNYACDFLINGQLLERGFEMPPGGLHDPKFTGMSADEIYEILPDQPPSDQSKDFLDLDESQGQGDGEGEDGEGNDGKPKGMGAAKLQQAIEDVVIRAAMQSKMAGDKAGTVPGDIQVFLDKLLDPKLPWHRILAKYMNKYSKNDYSWKKPSRRFFPKHYLPTLHSESIMDLCFAVDISGSVSDEDFKSFVSEISGVMKMLKPGKITLIQFDTDIKSVDKIRNMADLMKVQFAGRGGTDVECVMQWAEKNKPQALLFFTDGEFHVPETIANTDLVWLIHNNPRFTFPSGKVIHYELK